MAIATMQYGLDCHKCSTSEKIENGCTKDSPIKDRWKIDDFISLRCPKSLITNVSYEYLEAYTLFKLGILPNGDGWINESKKFIDAMRIIQSEIARMENNGRK